MTTLRNPIAPLVVLFVLMMGAQYALASRQLLQAVPFQPFWGQCGGAKWGGVGTCQLGSACTFVNSFFSQCQLIPPPKGCSDWYGQCGGKNPGTNINWTGPRCCPLGAVCQQLDPMYYHQCLPNPNPGPGPASVGCAGPTDSTCDFHFSSFAASKAPPKFLLDPVDKQERKITTSSIVDSTTGFPVKVNTDDNYLMGPIGQPLVTGEPKGQFYGTDGTVKVRTFNAPYDNVNAFQNQCVILHLKSVQLLDANGNTVNLNDGKDDAKYPEHRRCVIFQT